jgi:hypothetical protein
MRVQELPVPADTTDGVEVTDMSPAVYHFQRSPSLPVYQGCPGLVGDEGVAGSNHWGGYRM